MYSVELECSLFEQFLVECCGEWQVNDDSIVDGKSTHNAYQLEVVQTVIE